MKKTKLYSMKKLSKEFADNTSMHGLKFIAQDEATLAERYSKSNFQIKQINYFV